MKICTKETTVPKSPGPDPFTYAGGSEGPTPLWTLTAPGTTLPGLVAAPKGRGPPLPRLCFGEGVTHLGLCPLHHSARS